MNLKRYIQRVSNRLCITSDLSRDAEQMIQSILIHIYLRILSTSCFLLSTTYKACKDTSHLSPKQLLVHVCELLFSGVLQENLISILNDRSSLMRQFPIFVHTTIRDAIGTSCFGNPITLNKQFTINLSCLLEYLCAELIEIAGSNENLIITSIQVIDSIKRDKDISAFVRLMNIILVPPQLNSHSRVINEEEFQKSLPNETTFTPEAYEFLRHYYHFTNK